MKETPAKWKCFVSGWTEVRSYQRATEQEEHTFSAAVAMYGEEEDDLGAEVAEVARQAKQLLSQVS